MALTLIQCRTASENSQGELPSMLSSKVKEEEKQKGVHLFRSRDSTDLQFLHEMNVEWITLVPWGFQEDFDSPEVRHHWGDSTEIKKHNTRWINRVNNIQSKGFKIFLKPHVWMDNPSDGKWRSDIEHTKEEDWEEWKETYRTFILRYAELAELTQVEMFCIGTEFSKLSLAHPEYWKELIKEIRQVYSGKLTYAANWYQEYEEIKFWDQLDYIGIQAYFPLSKRTNPRIEELIRSWGSLSKNLKAVSQEHDKKILFTEMGFKSTSDAAIRPWEWIDYENQNKVYSAETQNVCYASFFFTIWKEDWFAGMHLWQIRAGINEEDMKYDFSPQFKPAQETITNGFGK